MLFGALTLAVSTTVTSCKDYDDDIKGLQEQVNNIKSTNPVSTEDMKAAVEKAQTELQGKLDALNTQLNDKAAASKLESEIQRLEQALKDAVGENASDLTSKLVKVQNELTALNNAMKDEGVVGTLKKEVENLKEMQTTLSALIEAEKKYNASGDISGFNNTSFDKFVNQKIKDALSDSDPDNLGQIAAYIQKAVQSGVATQTTAIDQMVADKTGSKLTSLSSFVETVYNDLYGTEGTIKKQLDELDGLVDAINATIKKGQESGENVYQNYEDVLMQIETTRLQLAALNLPSDKTYDQIVQDVISAELNKTGSALNNLKKELQAEIDAIKGMIQSIVYVPEYADGIVQFNTFYAKFGNEGNIEDWSSIINVDEISVKFRVSPQSAVAELLKGTASEKYKIAVDYQAVKTRATGTIFDVKKINAVDKEPNLIEVVLDASKVDQSYAVALTVMDKATEGKGLNDISSNYFAAVKNNLYINDIVWTPKEQPSTVAKEASIDYKTGGDYTLTVHTKLEQSGSTSDPDSRTKPSEYGISMDAKVFAVAFELTGTDSENNFILGEGEKAGVLTGKKDGAVSGKCIVKSVVTVKDPADGSTPKEFTETSYNEVTLTNIAAPIEATLALDEPIIWDGTQAQELAINADEVAEIKVKLGGISDFGACKFTAVTPETPAIMLGKNASNELVLIVPQNTVYNGDVTTNINVSDNSIDVTVKNVVVDYPSDVALATNTHSWDGKTAVLNKAVIGSPIEEVKATRTLTELFSNYSKVYNTVNPLGGAIEFNLKKAVTGVDLDELTGVITVDNSYSYKNAITVIVTVKCGEKVLYTSAEIPVAIDGDEFNGTFGYVEPAEGSEQKAGELILDVTGKSTRKAAIKLSDALVWTDATVDKNKIWPTVDRDIYDKNDPMTIYNFAVADYKFVGNANEGDNQYFTLANGELTLSEDIANGSQNTVPMEVKIIVTPTSPWGDMTNQAKVVTVKVPIWKD